MSTNLSLKSFGTQNSSAMMKQHLGNDNSRQGFEGKSGPKIQQLQHQQNARQTLNFDKVESIDMYMLELEKLQRLIDNLKYKYPKLLNYLASGINEGDSVQAIFHRVALDAQSLDQEVNQLILEYRKSLHILQHFQKPATLRNMNSRSSNSQEKHTIH